MKKGTIQSTRRRRLAIIDPLRDPIPELAPGDPVQLRWSYPDIDEFFLLPDGRDAESTGIVVSVDDDLIPPQVTVLWSTGELLWDYADDLIKIEAPEPTGGP